MYSIQCLLNNAIEAIHRRREKERIEELTEGEESWDQVSVELRVDEDNDQIRIVVHDTGIGISEEDQRLVFEPFSPTEDPRILSGMGLFSVKRIVNAHEGSIEVESAYGQGTTITIALPRSGC